MSAYSPNPTTSKMIHVAEEMARRRSAQSPLLKLMQGVADRYNGDVAIPIFDQDQSDLPMTGLAPLMIADAVDNTALYATQARPTIKVPALDATKDTGVRSRDYAQRRRKAIAASWDESWIELFFGRMYRHLAGYASSALVVELDYERRMPLIRGRNPLAAYPEPKAPEDLTLPRDCGFIFSRSLGWLHHNFPATKERFPRPAFATSTGEDELWDIVEWYDEADVVMGVLGPRDTFQSWTDDPGKWCWELSCLPNVLGRCPAIVPRRVTLDRIVSQLSNLTGHADLMAKLMHLDVLATEKSIYPDKFVIAKQGQQPRLLSGGWQGGETGEINMVIDADQIGELRGTPDPNNKQTIDRIERNMRISAGTVPAQGGETYGAMRTGRGIDSLMGAALDPRTAELHHIAERYLGAANELVLLAYAKRWPSRSYAVSAPWDPGEVEFIPSRHIEKAPSGKPHVANRVVYPIPGVDDANATLVLGQMLQLGLISQDDAMEMHPLVVDPEATKRASLIAQLEAAQSQSILQAASSGTLPHNDMSRIIELVYAGKALHEAVALADREASERQASAAPPPPEGMVAAPEEMPGLSMPGMGAEMGPGVAAEPPSGLQDIQALTQALQAPQGVA